MPLSLSALSKSLRCTRLLENMSSQMSSDLILGLCPDVCDLCGELAGKEHSLWRGSNNSFIQRMHEGGSQGYVGYTSPSPAGVSKRWPAPLLKSSIHVKRE